MKTIYLEGLPKLTPENWGELTLGQARAILSNPDAERDTYASLAAILGPGVTRAQVMNLPLDDAEALLAAAQFLGEPIPEFTKKPAALEVLRAVAGSSPTQFERVRLEVPEALELATFGQACDLGVSCEALAEDVPALRIRALAIYLLPAFVGGPYDTDRLVEVEAAVADLPLADAIPISDFFLRISRQPSDGTARPYSSASSARPRSEPASPSSGRVGIITPSPRRLPAAINYLSRLFSVRRGPK